MRSPTKQSESVQRVFHALADPTRQDIVERLMRNSATAGELGKAYRISAPGISKHLRILEKSKLVTRHRLGREHHFEVNIETFSLVIDWGQFYLSFWKGSLDRLEKFITSKKK